MTQASELSGLELRRAVLIALGYQAVHSRAKWCDLWIFTKAESPLDQSPYPHVSRIVDWAGVDLGVLKFQGSHLDFEKSGTLSERALIDLCRKHGMSWDLQDYCGDKCCQEARYICSIGKAKESGYEEVVEAAGATPSEARCRAIVAFCEAQKGKA